MIIKEFFMKRIISAFLAVIMILSICSVDLVSAAEGESLSLHVNWDDIKTVGHQTPYTGSCACFAVAYCRTILDKQVHYWYEYDWNGGAYGQGGALAYWWNGKYATAQKNTEAETYKFIYDQINLGRPVIVYVTGGRSTGQHWVTVVGYQNVTDVNKLSSSNFLYIDSVSKEFKAENLAEVGYRLLYSYGAGYTVVYTETGSAEFANNNTYSFEYNANGGQLGESGAFTAAYDSNIKIQNTTCTRQGYNFVGWNIRRNNDDTWYVDGLGWFTESRMKDSGYSKKVFLNGQTYRLDKYWIHGITGDCSYTMYAVWESALPELKISAASLSLQNNLVINFKVNGEVFAENCYKEPRVEVRSESETTVVDTWWIEEDSGRYVFSFKNISPKMIGDSFEVVLYAKDLEGNEVKSEALNYGVEKYCKNQLEKTAIQDSFRTMIVDLLNYGAASQYYTNYKTTDLSNAFLNEDSYKSNLEYATETVDLSSFEGIANSAHETVNKPKIRMHGANLMLNDSVNIRVAVSVLAESDFDGVKMVVKKENGSLVGTYDVSVNANATYYTTQDGRMRYYVRFNGLNSTEMSDILLIKFVDENGNAISNTMRYSVGCYAYSKQNDANTNLADMVKAMMKYGNAAKAWFNAQ